jgi:hypothetical protein
MDGQQRGVGHAALQPRPGRPPERAPSARETLVEPAGLPPERQDLRPRQVKPSLGHLITKGITPNILFVA